MRYGVGPLGDQIGFSGCPGRACPMAKITDASSTLLEQAPHCRGLMIFSASLYLVTKKLCPRIHGFCAGYSRRPTT